MDTAKEEVLALLDLLPQSCSLEDIRYHLHVLVKVRRGMGPANTQPAFTQQQAEERLQHWLTE